MPHYLYDKNELQLNLHPVATEPKLEGLRKNATPSELRSPDFGLLKLGSPELEKMIMCLQGSVTTNSTPCSFYNTTSNASINTSNENYSRGFTETLQDLHDKQSTGESLIDLADNAVATDPFLGQPSVHNGGSLMNPNPPVIKTASEPLIYSTNTTRNDTGEYYPSNSNVYSNSRGGAMFNPYPQTCVNTGYPNVYSYPPDNLLYQDHFSNDNNTAFRAFSPYGNVLNQQKQELQPSFKMDPAQAQVMADPGILQPIDLEIQEVVKRERKKQRNRVASSKCRKRKLEREARLENRVKDLKERNIELNAVANALKQQVCDLKQKVMDHVGEGCQIMLVHQSQMSTC
jgi:hypothetical protein